MMGASDYSRDMCPQMLQLALWIRHTRGLAKLASLVVLIGDKSGQGSAVFLGKSCRVWVSIILLKDAS